MTNILFEQHMRSSRQILAESVSDLNVAQRRIVEGIYGELRPLIEASLTADQITRLFGEVEKTATASGDNRSALGKAADVPKKANEIINNIGKWLQDTTPVKMADQKFEQLKAKVSAKFPELDKQLTGLGSWMKENPGKSAAIIGVLTALASLAGGPVGGAIAGQVLRGAAELVKGEKLSTAVGKGIKTAALGYLSGKAFEMLGGWLAGFREQSIPFGAEDAGLEQVSWSATKSLKAPGMEWTQSTQGFNALVRPEEAEAIRAAMAGVKAGDASAFDSLLTVAREVNSKDYKAGLDAAVQGAWKAAKDNDSLLQFINTAKQGLQAGAQGAVAASTGSEKKESYYRQQRPLSEGQVYLVFNRIERLDEGPMDWIKDKAGKAAAWAGKKVGNLTNTVTADKLNSAWQAAGSPTDSEELKKFLQDQGVSPEIINTVYKSMKISSAPAAATGTVYTQLKQDVLKLDSKGKQRIAAYLKKQLGTV